MEVKISPFSMVALRELRGPGIEMARGKRP
jgi:hypothetical protein